MIIDDGSSDRTIEIANQYNVDYFRVDFKAHKKSPYQILQPWSTVHQKE